MTCIVRWHVSKAKIGHLMFNGKFENTVKKVYQIVPSLCCCMPVVYILYIIYQ